MLDERLGPTSELLGLAEQSQVKERPTRFVTPANNITMQQ